MPLPTLLRVGAFSSTPPPPPPPSAAPIQRRRPAPLSRALWVLSVGALTALAYRTGSAHSLRQFPLLRSKFVNRSSVRNLQSTAMEAASSTVPSIVVYVTVPNKEADDHIIRFNCKQGNKLSESIIKERLAACVNRVPGIESVYWWDGKVQRDSEELLIIKTRVSLLDALTEHVQSNHEYEVPEVISMPITGGNLKYLEWIKNNTREN